MSKKIETKPKDRKKRSKTKKAEIYINIYQEICLLKRIITHLSYKCFLFLFGLHSFFWKSKGLNRLLKGKG